MERAKEGSIPRLPCGGCRWMPSQSELLSQIEGILAEFLFADKGYDTNEILEYDKKIGIEIVIRQRKTD